MKPAHRVYLFRQQLVSFALVSFLLNGLVGWILYQPFALALTWRGLTVGVDALIMTLVTAFAIGPVVIPLAVQKIRRAQLPPVARHSRSRGWIQYLPTDSMTRSAVVGLGAATVIVPVVLGTMASLQGSQISANQFVLIRASLTAVCAGLMAALFAWIGLVDASS